MTDDRSNDNAEEKTEQDGTFSETIENIPDYLSDIDPVRRKEIVDISAEITRDIPGAVICGGNANRILYEVYTGKTMFGVGKNDSDIYVSHANLERFLIKQPEGYELKHELDMNGEEKWIRPEDDYIVFTHSGEHIDVFGTSDSHESTTVELDGQTIRVQSLTDQIKDKVRLMYETEGLTRIDVDPVHNPDPISKYGVYAQRILEMADSERGQAELAEHPNELPGDWRETLEAMASQGKYGDQLDPEKREAFQEKMDAWKKTQEMTRQIQEQIIKELREYYDVNHGKAPEERSGSLPNFLNGFESKIEASLDEASGSDKFIQTIIDKLSADERKKIKDRIKVAVGKCKPIEQIASDKKMGFLSRIFSSEKTYLAISIVSIVIIVLDFIRMLLFDNQKDLWAFILGHISLIFVVILSVVQLLRLKGIFKKPALFTPQWLSKFSAIISLACSPIPLVFMIYFLIVFGDSMNKPGGADAFALALVFYYVIIGFLAFFIWLVCGIIGLKTNRRKLAIISLILRPVGFLIIAIVMAILEH